MNTEQSAVYIMKRKNRSRAATERIAANNPKTGTGDTGVAQAIADALSDLTDAIHRPRPKPVGIDPLAFLPNSHAPRS